MASSSNDNAAKTSAGIDSAAAEAVQRALALVRTATGKLRNPVPASSNNLTGGFLASLLEPIKQQQTLVNFNPLDAQSFADLATQAAQQVSAAAMPAARSAEQDGFVKALVAATAKAGQKATASAAVSTATSQAISGAAGKTAPRKFTLVKPSSLQDVNSQLIDMWDQIAATTPSPELKKIAENNRKTLQQINKAIAPRATAGRSAGATLGKLLQGIGGLTDEGIASLVQGRGIGGMIDDAFGTKPSKPAPSPVLVKLAEIVGDVWGQPAPPADAQHKRSDSAKKSRPTVTPSTKANVPVEDSVAAPAAGGIAPQATPTTPVTTTVNNGAGAPAAAVDVYAIANGLNDVLREQAWLAGVDLT